MIKQRIMIQLAVLMFALPTMAVADNLPTLPVPHFTDAPAKIPEGPARTVHFSFSPTRQNVSGYELNSHVQQWYCLPGKDVVPSNGETQAEPWAGQQPSCKQEDNWGGLPYSTSTITSGSIMFPIRGEAHLVPGTLYVRIKLYWANHAGSTIKAGGWSAWHRTVVTDTHRARFMGAQGMRADRSHVNTINIAAKIVEKSKPPVITAPRPAQVFHGSPINLSVNVGLHQATGGDWSCCDIQWKRAVILMPENNAYAQAHTPGHSAFPTPPMPWQLTRMMGFAVNVKEVGTSLHGSVFYNDLRPHKRAFGYRYVFRMREYYWPNGLGGLTGQQNYPGPWSAWRSFTVQEPLMAATPNHNMRMLPGAHMAKPSSGKQQSGGQHNTRRLAPMPMMRVR